MLEAKKNYNENKVVSIIGPGTTINGDVSSQGTIRVEGVVKGRINSKDTIVIHDTGKVKADLIAGQIIISGEVHGNIFAHERLEVKSTGKIHGDIACPRIAIAEGVVFEGKCTMKPPGELKTPDDKKAQGNGEAPQKEKPNLSEASGRQD